MIYLDSSVALAFVLAENRAPTKSFWSQELTSSELLEYEVLNRAQVRGGAPHANIARELLTGIRLVEMSRPVLARALEPFPLPVRTLDALHLASMDYLRARGQAIALASYDHRLNDAALALGFPLAEL